MERMELINFLTSSSPFDLNNDTHYRALLGVKTEIHDWVVGSSIWHDVYNVLADMHWLNKCGRKTSVDFRPLFSLSREAMKTLRRVLNDKDLENLTESKARVLLSTLAEFDTTEKYVIFLTGVSRWNAGSADEIDEYNYTLAVSELSEETVRKALKWLSLHAFCEDVMTKDERFYASSLI